MATKTDDKKKLRTTTFGELDNGMWFVFLGEYLQRGMFDNPKNPVRYVKISDRRYINALALINGKLPPKSRLTKIAHHINAIDHAVVICPRGF